MVISTSAYLIIYQVTLSSNVGMIRWVFFCARGKAEGYKTHLGHNFYLILQQGTYLECLKRSIAFFPIENAHFYP